MPERNEPAPDEWKARIAALEAENARLRWVEAAAQEASACLEGRRPGFGVAYAAELLRTALEGRPKKADARPRRPGNRRPVKRPR